MRGAYRHGLGMIGVQMSLIAITHAELNAEIDGDADEHYGEGHGNQVQ